MESETVDIATVTIKYKAKLSWTSPCGTVHVDRMCNVTHVVNRFSTMTVDLTWEPIELPTVVETVDPTERKGN